MAGRLVTGVRRILAWSPPPVRRVGPRRRWYGGALAAIGMTPETAARWHRRLLLAVGAAPTCAVVAGTLVSSFRQLAEGIAPALGTIVLLGPLAFTFFALAPLIAARELRAASPERRHELAPVVWLVAAAALFWQWLVFVVPPPEGATVSGRMNVWWLGLALQGVAWAAGAGFGAARRRQQAAIEGLDGD